MQKDPTNCAIGRDGSNGSCFTLQELHQIASTYNKNNPKDIIKLLPTKKEMIEQLTNKLTKCTDQSCWLTILKLDEKLKNTFKPLGPVGQFDWLSTTEINECMSRYMEAYPDFLFIGAVPIDIEDLSQFGVGTLNFEDLLKINKSKIGIIYNLDEHDKSGSHWVSFFIDLNKHIIYYSDSAGKPPEKRVKRLVKRIAEQWYAELSKRDNNIKKINIKFDSYMSLDKNGKPCKNIIEQQFDIRFNTTQHQFGGSECGVYSINFIARLLQGDTFDEINDKRVTDKDVNLCRGVYYSNYDNIIKGGNKSHTKC